MIPNKKTVRGLAQDFAPIDMPQGAMAMARNVYLHSVKAAISNEKGFKELFDFENKVVGSIPLDGDDFALLSITSSGDSEIGRYNNSTNTYTRVLVSDLLNFQLDQDIQGVFIRNFKKEAIIIFVDNYNPPRLINLDNLPLELDDYQNIVDSESFPLLNLFPDYKQPFITVDSVMDYGSINTGVVQLCTAYVLTDGTYTDFSFVGEPVSLIEGSSDENYYSLEGSVGGVNSGKSIRWSIADIDFRYEKIVFAVIEKNEGVVTAKLLGEKPTTINSFVYQGAEVSETIDIAEILVKNAKYNKAKTITSLDNRLFLGNVSVADDLNYQSYANNIGLGWVVENVDLIVSANSHKDPKKIAETRGFMWDEVYAFYITFLMKDGSLSKDYHIPGRDANEGEKDTIIDLVNDGNDYLKNDLSIAPNAKFFQTRETASKYLYSSESGHMGYWENQNEQYPDDAEVWGDLANQNVRHHKFPAFDTYKEDNTFYDEPNYYAFKVEKVNGKLRDKDKFPLIQPMGAAYTLASDNYGESFHNCNREALMNPFSVSVQNSDTVSYDPVKSEFLALEDCDINLDLSIYLEAISYTKNKGGSCFPGAFDNGGYTKAYSELKIIKIDTSGAEILLYEDIVEENDRDDNEWHTLTAKIDYANLLNVTVDEGERIKIVAYCYAHAQDTGRSPTIVPVDLNTNSYAEIKHSIQIKGYTTPQGSGTTIPDVRTMPILGVEVGNIEIPAEIADKVDGYYISYAKRSLPNMRVIGWSGMFHNQSHHPTYEDYIGAGAGTKILSSDTAETIHWRDDTLRFHAFDMMYDNYAVKPSYLKLNAVINSTAEDIKRIDVDATYGDTDEEAAERASYRTKVQSSFRADYIGGTVTTADFITDENQIRKVTQGEYIPADAYVGATKSGETLVNYFSESMYHAKIEHLEGIDIGTNRAAYNWTPYRVIDGSETQFVVNQDHLVGDGSMEIPLALISLFSYKEDVYVNFYEQETAATNKITKVDSEGTYSTAKIFGGDITVNGYGLRLTSGVRMEQTGSYVSPDATNKFEATKCIYYFPVYSINNVGYRYKGTADYENFYPLVGKKYTNHSEWLRRSVDAINSNSFLYNNDYTSVNDLNNRYGIFNPYSKELSDFPYRVVRSKSYQPEDEEFSMRIFQEADYYELPKEKGSIQNLVNLSSALIIHNEYALFRTINKETIETTSLEVTLGTGDLFRQPPQELIPTTTGYAGIQHSSSSLLFKGGYFFVDEDQGKVFLLDSQVNEISREGMSNYFFDNKGFRLEEDLGISSQNAANRVGYCAAFDEEENRIILTKKDYTIKDRSWLEGRVPAITVTNGVISYNDLENQTSILIDDSNFLEYFDEVSSTITFDMDVRMWISFHDYFPNHMLNTRNYVYSFNNSYDKIYRHNEEDIYAIYYNQDKMHRSFVDLVHNDNQPYSKTFASLQWYTESIDQYGNYNYKDTFTQAMVYNAHQCSGEVSLTPLSNMRYIEGSWSFNDFRDLVSDRDFPFIDEYYELIEENIDSNKQWYDQKRFTDKFLISRLIYDNCQQNSLYLYYYGSRSRLSAR